MRLFEKFSQLFDPEAIQELSFWEVTDALGDPAVRMAWSKDIQEELKRINLEVDSRLVNGFMDFADLSGRRKGIQYALEAVLASKRKVADRRGPNPDSGFDLESVTVGPAPR